MSTNSKQYYLNIGFNPKQANLMLSLGAATAPATTTTVGVVKKSVSVANPAALTTTQTAGGAYTANEQAMLNAVKADLAALRTTLDNVMTNNKTAGQM
jgi:hypothetical protein